MDLLWAPWRNQYIMRDLKKKRGCVFCRMEKERRDAKNFVIARRKYCFAVLNIYPYNNGHVLIVTARHVDDLDKLRKAERDDVMDLVQDVKSMLQSELDPAGFNIGINLGRVAGAGYPGHLHIHLVPRWNGDVNFMPVTGKAKVITQSLAALYKKLKNADPTGH